jgi:hypothetical protein
MGQSHNRPKSPNEIEIAPGYPIQRYIELKTQRKGAEISELIRSRFDARFFSPLGYSLAKGEWNTSEDRNTNPAKPSGWLMVSVACLSVESLIAFTKGLIRVPNCGEEFTAFFESNAAFAYLLKAFPAFKYGKNGKEKKGNKFYSLIRCGLLHQAETSESWRLLLGHIGGPMVTNTVGMPCIYAKPIFAGVGNAIRSYCENLATNTEFTTDRKSEWGKALRKLDAIAEGCGVKSNALGNPIRLRKQANIQTPGSMLN